MDNKSVPNINVISSSLPTFEGDYYIITLSKSEDRIISQEAIKITSRECFTTVLEKLNQYNNEHDDSYRKLINNPIIN
jgi:hypothetical protein